VDRYGTGSWPRRDILSLLGFTFLACLAPLLLTNEYYVTVLIFMGINVILVIGLNLLMGYTGQISLGHAAFFALGAYGSGILNTRAGWDPWLSMPASMVLTGVLAYLIGKPILKLKGNYLAMATLGFGLIVEHMLVEWGDLTGGPSGLSGVERLSVGSLHLYTPGIRYYYLVLAAVFVCIVFAHNLVDSRTGRALRAIHGSEIAANTLGVDASRLKLHVFVLSAVIAAMGGALYVHYLGFIAPASCGFKYSIQLVTMVVVGGMATIWGSVLGAAVLTLLPQVLTFLEDYDILVYGLILILMVLFMPEGIARGSVNAAQRIREKLAGIRGRPDPERGAP
jgi:branched-chain amino acid transport system permease protein